MTTFRRLLCVAVVGIGCGLVPSLASAQTGACPAAPDLVVNPTWICVQPSSSAAHTASDPLDSATIARYDILFFAPGVDTAAGAPVQTIPLGKPALNAQGVFWVQRSELLAIPVGQQYRARTVAVGVTGLVSLRSPESNPFGRVSGASPAAPAVTAVR